MSSLGMRRHFVKGSVLHVIPRNAYAFRQGICSSCHPSKCVCVSSRDLFFMSSLETRMRFVKGSTMFNVAGRQEKGVSDIVIKIGRSLNDFAERKIER